MSYYILFTLVCFQIIWAKKEKGGECPFSKGKKGGRKVDSEKVEVKAAIPTDSACPFADGSCPFAKGSCPFAKGECPFAKAELKEGKGDGHYSYTKKGEKCPFAKKGERCPFAGGNCPFASAEGIHGNPEGHCPYAVQSEKCPFAEGNCPFAKSEDHLTFPIERILQHLFKKGSSSLESSLGASSTTLNGERLRTFFSNMTHENLNRQYLENLFDVHAIQKLNAGEASKDAIILTGIDEIVKDYQKFFTADANTQIAISNYFENVDGTWAHATFVFTVTMPGEVKYSSRGVYTLNWVGHRITYAEVSADFGAFQAAAKSS